jgi:hypothetical protein
MGRGVARHGSSLETRAVRESPNVEDAYHAVQRPGVADPSGERVM